MDNDFRTLVSIALKKAICFLYVLKEYSTYQQEKKDPAFISIPSTQNLIEPGKLLLVGSHGKYYAILTRKSVLPLNFCLY